MTSMSAKQYLAIASPPKRSKYGAKASYRCRLCGCADDEPVPCIACGATDPIRFASGAEARRYDVLRLEEKAGLISVLRLQVPYPIKWNGVLITTYVADFVYFRGGKQIVLDVKGVQTPAYRIKKKLLLAQYDISIVEVR